MTETPGEPNPPTGTHQSPPPSQRSENKPQETPKPAGEEEQRPVKGERQRLPETHSPADLRLTSDDRKGHSLLHQPPYSRGTREKERIA